MSKNIPMSEWGKDHWSTLAYIETRITDHNGIPALPHMRCNPELHPGLAHTKWSKDYPTRLTDGKTVTPHDDWSCLDDAEPEGLVENVGSGLNRMYRLTDLGMMVCNALRNHKADGGGFGTFWYEPLKLESDSG